MPRQYVLDPSIDGNPSTPQPTPRVKLRVQWTIDGNLKDVVGFNVCLTTTSGSPLNSASVKKFVFVENPASVEYTFTDMVPGDYLAWVQTVARGGDSKWMSSSTLTVADDNLPTVRGTDDRNIQAFCEDFRSASLPTGVTISDGSYNLTAEAGKIRLTANHASNTMKLLWDVEPWIDAYLAPEAKKDGIPTLIFRCKVDTAVAAGINGFDVEVKLATGSAFTYFFDIIRDGLWHNYRIPYTQPITLAGANSATVAIWTYASSGDMGGGYIWFDAIALGFNNFDMALDGNVDKGITSWNQFDNDPTGGGYFLTSPVRPIGEDGGSQLIIDENGVYWLENNAGDMITRTPFKRGIVGTIRQPSSGSTVLWNSSTYLSPTISPPIATNKIRMILERLGGVVAQATTPAVAPVRVFLEASDMNESGFRVNCAILEGGTLGKHTITVAGLGSSSQYKEDMTLHAASGTLHADDAFYLSSDDGSPFVSGKEFLRAVAWIRVKFAEAKKANGSHYWARLVFEVTHGTLTAGTPPTVGSGAVGFADISCRVMSDGKAWLFPWIAGYQFSDSSGFQGAYNRQDYWVRFKSITRETGFSASPTEVKLDHLDFEYVTFGDGGAMHPQAGENLKFTFLEEF